MNKTDLNKKFAAMKSEGESWLSTWREIQPYVAPHRGYFNNQPNNGSKIDHKTLMKSVGPRSLLTLAAGLTSGLTSPSRPWFKLTLPDPELMKFEPVKYWLEEVEKRMLATFARSNIYSNFTAMYEEIGAFSTAAMILLDDPYTIIRGRHFTAGEYYIDQDDRNRVNTFAREWAMTTDQMIAAFGEENVSDKIRSEKKNGKNGWHTVRHMILPNGKYTGAAKDGLGMKFSSYYFEANGEDDGKLLGQGGYRTFPVISPRWGLSRPSDVYGRSAPGWLELGNLREVQKLEKDYLTSLALVNKPPMLKPSSLKGAVQMVPGGVTPDDSANPSGGVRPAFQIRPDLAAMQQKIEKLEAEIRSGFFVDLFLMLNSQDNPQMTATEIYQRNAERLQVVSPLLESFQNEGLKPTIDRAFDIMMEKNALPPPPAELQGMELDVEYISPLAQAQKMLGTTSIEQGVRFVGSVLEVAPEVRDIVDFDEAARQHLNMDGVSPKIIRSPEAVDSIRKARAEQEAQAKAMEQAAVLANGAKTLSDTKVGGGSALDVVLSGIAGNPSGQMGIPQ